MNEYPTGNDRRQFLRLAALGGGAALLATTSWAPDAMGSGTTEALLLTCMDFRLMDEIERYMTERGLRDKYDHIILAGAALGATTDKFPAWTRTFWEHLDISIKLHHIQRVVIMDHRDCGAYKVILGPEVTSSREHETETHAKTLRAFRDQINERYTDLEVEMLLMDLDGKVEVIA